MSFFVASLLLKNLIGPQIKVTIQLRCQGFVSHAAFLYSQRSEVHNRV